MNICDSFSAYLSFPCCTHFDLVSEADVCSEMTLDAVPSAGHPVARVHSHCQIGPIIRRSYSPNTGPMIYTTKSERYSYPSVTQRPQAPVLVTIVLSGESPKPHGKPEYNRGGAVM